MSINAFHGDTSNNMPTGYTSKIYNGEKVSFEQFTWDCARAFGALVMLRDDSSAKIPKAFKAGKWHAKRIDENKAKLAAAEKWSATQANAEAKKLYDRETREYLASVAKNNALRIRYEKILVEAESWNPPTPEHEGLKKFMVEQLQQSLEFDCHTPKKPIRMTGEEHKRATIEDAHQSISYSMEEQGKETQRAHDRTKWVVDLRENFIELKKSRGTKEKASR